MNVYTEYLCILHIATNFDVGLIQVGFMVLIDLGEESRDILSLHTHAHTHKKMSVLTASKGYSARHSTYI